MKTARFPHEETAEPLVANARVAAGLTQVIRCASTDSLAQISSPPLHPDRCLGPMDLAILERAGLILDLRSASERNEEEAQSWMSSTKEAFRVREFQDSQRYSEKPLKDCFHQHRRLVARLDLLSPNRFMNYVEENWFSPAQKAQANQWKTTDQGKLHSLRLQALNQRGLLGLNEAILETGKEGICTALQLITLHFERQIEQSAGPTGFHIVVVHCVQGKDRTGVLIMLCQALMGVPDEWIVEDYSKSHNNFRKQRQQNPSNALGTSAAMERVTSTASKTNPRVKLARSMWNSAPPSVMRGTLEYLRQKYGSIAPGYLHNIGFDANWQERFQSACSSIKFADEIVQRITSRL